MLEIQYIDGTERSYLGFSRHLNADLSLGSFSSDPGPWFTSDGGSSDAPAEILNYFPLVLPHSFQHPKFCSEPCSIFAADSH